MNDRVQPGQLRRELRFSRSTISQNLESIGVSMDEVKPLLEAFMTTNGLLGLYGSELLLAEKALGISAGTPAVDLVGELVSVKQVPADTGVSYGYLSRTTANTTLGLVGIGFSDGIPRSATNQIKLSISGRSYPGIGRIAMDQCIVDLGQDSPKLGAEVSFFNGEFGLSDWALVSGFSQLEILGRITDRVVRTWSE